MSTKKKTGVLNDQARHLARDLNGKPWSWALAFAVGSMAGTIYDHPVRYVLALIGTVIVCTAIEHFKNLRRPPMKTIRQVTFEEWIPYLREIAPAYGYDEIEAEDWRHFFEDGLTPRQAIFADIRNGL